MPYAGIMGNYLYNKPLSRVRAGRVGVAGGPDRCYCLKTGMRLRYIVP